MRTDIIDTHHGGMWPWLGQRITAVVVIVTIIVHIVLTHYIAIGELSFDNIAERLGNTAVLINDVLLLLAVVYPRPQRAAHGRARLRLAQRRLAPRLRRAAVDRRHRGQCLRDLGPLGLGQLRRR